MTENEILAKLNQIIGSQEQAGRQRSEDIRRLDEIGDRVGRVEGLVAETKDVVEAWAAAKVSLRFAKWLAGFIAALIAVVGAVKGWWHK